MCLKTRTHFLNTQHNKSTTTQKKLGTQFPEFDTFLAFDTFKNKINTELNIPNTSQETVWCEHKNYDNFSINVMKYPDRKIKHLYLLEKL